jgi:hypothetical protein
MINVFLSICGLILSLSYSNIACAGKTDFLTVEYDILSEGEAIGALTHKLFRNGSRISLYEQSRIDISGWWGKINISGFLVEELDSNNRFVRSESADLDGSTIYRSTIKVNNNQLLASFAELKEISHSDREQFTRLLQVIGNIQDEQPENLHSLSSALFEKRGKTTEKVLFDSSVFDTTENNLPIFIQSLGGKPLPKQLRLLSTEDLTIDEVSVTDLGYEAVAVGAKTFRCRHLKLVGKSYRPSHIWIDETSRSLPYMVRFTGEDEHGAVEISLKE